MVRDDGRVSVDPVARQAHQRAMLADRYGSPPPWRRRALLVAVAVVALAFAGWLGWTIWEQSRPVVSSGDLSYRVVDDNLARTRFTVEYRDGVVATTCTLRAYAEDHTLVGELSFTPQPSPDGTVEQPLSTDRRATSVELVGCTAPGQDRPR